MEILNLLMRLTLSVSIPISEISRSPCKFAGYAAMPKVDVINKLQRQCGKGLQVSQSIKTSTRDETNKPNSFGIWEAEPGEFQYVKTRNARFSAQKVCIVMNNEACTGH
jgi:hypothetical protein